VNTFLDAADNDYPIDVDVADQRTETRGQLIPARVYRFHDGYRAMGALAEGGLVDREFARRLLLRLFVNDHARELQNNPSGETPYGEVEFQERSVGGSARYVHTPWKFLGVDLVVGYAHTGTQFLDVATCLYNWFGQCVRERLDAGEIDEGVPRDDALRERAGFGRFTFEWHLPLHQVLRFSLAPTYIRRDGKDQLRSVSPIATDRQLLTTVSGIEHEAQWLNERLENIAFAKVYLQTAASEEPVTADVSRQLSRDTLRFGAGNSLRFYIDESLYAKSSYEYATRLPRVDELFGDALLTNENLALQPEASHNFNLGVTIDARDTNVGSWRGDLNGFLRETENLIVLLAAYGDRFRSENVFGARSIGVEASGGWTSRREYFSLDGNATYLDFRNREGKGPFEPFEGDRIPNRPYLFANGSAEMRLPELFAPSDRLSLTWYTRFVKEFFEFWESAGMLDSKRKVPDQLLHSLALTYLVGHAPRFISISGEVTNLTSARAFDFFGAQRPGRATFWKLTMEF
jgi:hypothetical protein